MRHLLHHFYANDSAAAMKLTASFATPLEQVPHLSLKDLLEEDGDVALAEAAYNNSSFGAQSNLKSSNEKYAFLDSHKLMNDSWGEAADGLAHETSNDNKIKRGGREKFTKPEMSALLQALEQSCKLPGLTDAERTQLFAIMDTLAEIDGLSGNAQLALLDPPGQRYST